MFKLIEEPISIPLSEEEAYKRQNEILKRMRFLHTAFEGIKLDFSNKKSLPVIRKGSICMFCYSMYETDTDIILTDNNKTDGSRYITLNLTAEGKSLRAEVVNSLDTIYSEELGGFYNINRYDGNIKKYIPCLIEYKKGIYESQYFDIYNNEVY